MAQEGNELDTEAYEDDASSSLAVPDGGSSNTDLAAASDTEDNGESTQEIRGQIEATRQQMGETIDAIQDRLSLANISEQVSEHVNNAVETAKDAVYDATVGKAAELLKVMGDKMSNSNVLKAVLNNPVPIALIGIGAAWLVLKSRSDRGRVQSSYRSGSKMSHDDATVGGKSNGITAAAGSAYNGLTAGVDAAYHGTGRVAGQVYDKVGDLGSSARDQYGQYMEDSPLTVGAVALALGAAVGLSIPSTQYEGELMGSAREQLWTKAQDSANDLIEQAKETVRDAAASARSGE